jgi:AGCS family alanine or glycine:cation symporter
MDLDLVNRFIVNINNYIWGWPLVLFVLVTGCVVTIGLKFIQCTGFFDAWKLLLFSRNTTKGDMSPFQAFLNALSSSLGNGSIAGIATAIYAGGPGAAFWIFVVGFLGMALRFAEVFLASYFPARSLHGFIVGGPMIYLSQVPFGNYLAYLYALCLLFMSFSAGNAMQANSIRLGFVRIFDTSPLVIAVILFLFMAYVMWGGAKRIVTVSDTIVPIKVGLFFSTAIVALAYHWAAIIPALKLIIKSALFPRAIAGASIGLLIQTAMRYGVARTANASESGLGTAAILFGGTGVQAPERNALMSMISVFISANLVSFMIALIIVASGTWNIGQTSLDLTISAYETVFGRFGAWIVTFLSVSFGMGVLVTYAYIARACWLFVTRGRYAKLYNLLFCITTFLGAIASVDLIWNATDLVNAGLLVLNLFGILWLLPLIRKQLRNPERELFVK